MEPISTLALVAAFLAPIPLTKRPDWSESLGRTEHFSIADRAPTNELIAPPDVATESIVLSPLANTVLDKRILIKREIEGYRFLENGWDGESSQSANSQSIQNACEFIDCLPSGLPLPGAMLSAAGEVGFYWDLEGGFADISFSTDGSASFFSRTVAGMEFFQDAIMLNELNPAWLFRKLGALATPRLRAA